MRLDRQGERGGEAELMLIRLKLSPLMPAGKSSRVIGGFDLKTEV